MFETDNATFGISDEEKRALDAFRHYRKVGSGGDIQDAANDLLVVAAGSDDDEFIAEVAAELSDHYELNKNGAKRKINAQRQQLYGNEVDIGGIFRDRDAERYGYEVSVGGESGTITLDRRELTRQDAFRQAIIAEFDVWVPSMKQGAWESKMAECWSDVDAVEVRPDV